MCLSFWELIIGKTYPNTRLKLKEINKYSIRLGLTKLYSYTPSLTTQPPSLEAVHILWLDCMYSCNWVGLEGEASSAHAPDMLQSKCNTLILTDLSVLVENPTKEPVSVGEPLRPSTLTDADYSCLLRM